MKALLDTHVALWWYENPELLNHASRAIIEDTGNAVFISSASVWELNLKVTLGKVKIPTGFVLKAMEDFLELPIRATHAEQLLKIDMLHRDRSGDADYPPPLWAKSNASLPPPAKSPPRHHPTLPHGLPGPQSFPFALPDRAAAFGKAGPWVRNWVGSIFGQQDTVVANSGRPENRPDPFPVD